MTARRLCRSSGRTDRGKVRERNEDAFLNQPDRGVWVVADGMGGHQDGGVASQLVVQRIAGLFHHGRLEDKAHALRQCLLEVHHRLGQGAAARGKSCVIGSTVVALLIEGERAVCIWAGDSRCYLWRGKRLYQLSRDHSLLQRLLDEEHMSPERAAQHPQAHALTRAVGSRDLLDLDVIELNIRQDDVFLLCSDGLYQAIAHSDLGKALNLKSPQLALNSLFNSALCGAARDNLTAVVIHV